MREESESRRWQFQTSVRGNRRRGCAILYKRGGIFGWAFVYKTFLIAYSRYFSATT
jgi:hypothetical protein